MFANVLIACWHRHGILQADEAALWIMKNTLDMNAASWRSTELLNPTRSPLLQQKHPTNGSYLWSSCSLASPCKAQGICVPGCYGRGMILTSRLRKGGIGVPVGRCQSKSMSNNNQVRRLCKFTGITQSPNTLADYKRNIYELKDNEKRQKADFWSSFLIMSRCWLRSNKVMRRHDKLVSFAVKKKKDLLFCSRHAV